MSIHIQESNYNRKDGEFEEWECFFGYYSGDNDCNEFGNGFGDGYNYGSKNGNGYGDSCQDTYASCVNGDHTSELYVMLNERFFIVDIYF